MPKYAEKICDMRNLLKYAKIRQSGKYAISTYSRFSDMPNCQLAHYKYSVSYLYLISDIFISCISFIEKNIFYFWFVGGVFLVSRDWGFYGE